MSWSITFVGNPDNINKALQAESERLTGASKQEFDAAMPSLVNLVNQNFNKTGPAPVLKLSANGHAYSTNDEPQYGSCNVTIENLGAVLV